MRIVIKSSRRRPDRIVLSLASMIDVTFLLLFFFVVTTAAVQQEDRLSPSLQAKSESSAGSRSEFQPQVLDVASIDGSPGYRIGSRVLRLRSELHEALTSLPKGAGLFVRVSNDVPVGFAVAAVQIGRDAGFDQVTYVPAQ